MVLRERESSYSTERINGTTFAITEDDKWGEHPVIYARIFRSQNVILLTDTGCDAPSAQSKDAQYTRLRQYLEECELRCLDSRALNPGGHLDYLVVITHCHYDHIGGVAQFKESAVVASAAGRDFVTNGLWEHSLCKIIGLPKPDYHPSLWMKNRQRLCLETEPSRAAYASRGCQLDTRSKLVDMGVIFFNTPGHTPDELAWYDEEERHLYVGDSFYYTGDASGYPRSYAGPIIFPKEGDVVTYLGSMEMLLSFVREKNADEDEPRVKVGCGHVSTAEDAEDMLQRVLHFSRAVIAGKVMMSKRELSRDEFVGTWFDDGKEVKLGIKAPLRLMVEAGWRPGAEDL